MPSQECLLCHETFDNLAAKLRHKCNSSTIAYPKEEASVTVVSDVKPTFSVTAVAPPKDVAVIDSAGNGMRLPVGSFIPAELLADKNVASKGLQHANTWSPYGEWVFNYCLRHKGDTINAIGRHGLGKTNLFKAIATHLGMDFITINCHPGMDIAWLIGMPAPTNTTNGVGLIWVDGELTRAVRNGTMIVMEEFNSMPIEMLTRLHGLMEHKNPTHTLPEASGLTDAYVPVHPDFWLVTSMNPVEGGYETSNLPAPVKDRLTYNIPVNQPLGDEAAILKHYFPEDTITYNADRRNGVQVESKLWHGAWARFIEEARPKLIDWPRSGVGVMPHLELQEKRATDVPYMSTRCLIDIAQAIKKGDTPTEVAVMVIADKYENSGGIATAFLSQFGRGVMKQEVTTNDSSNTATTS